MASRDTKRKVTADELLADEMAKCYADPLRHVMISYPWDTEPAIQIVEMKEPWASRYGSRFGPDEWECQLLDDVAAKVKDRAFDGRHAVEPIRFATVSGHGIGKSVTNAHIAKWIMDTRPFAKGILTANTDTQLRTKTWAELGKWHRLSLTQHWFDYNTGRGAMSLVHKQYKESWRLDAQTSREENSEAFAGLHAANSTPFYLFDEASGIADKIYEVRTGGLTDGEPMVFDWGNPTRNSGYFFEECEGKFKHRFHVRQIDSRTVAITNKKDIQQKLEDYGEDSDYFRVRVKGQFPKTGNTQFIGMDIVQAAMQRQLVEDRTAPLVIGVDVARFGNNDSVVWPRIGMDARSWKPGRFNGIDTVQLTGRVIEQVRYFRELGKETSAIFVDGGGIGGAVVDQLRALGYPVFEVHFGGKPTDTNTYRFKSDEMWGRMKEWLKGRGCIPTEHTEQGSKLKDDLTQREFGYTLLGNKIHLETKDEMAKRGLNSPDDGDALALTFAQEVASVAPGTPMVPKFANSDYDPYAEKDDK